MEEGLILLETGSGNCYCLFFESFIEFPFNLMTAKTKEILSL